MRVATGKCRWLDGTGTKENVRKGTALLLIISETKGGDVEDEYTIQSHRTAFTVQNTKKVKYLVRGNFCSCPDATKGNICKHVKALAVAIPKLK